MIPHKQEKTALSPIITLGPIKPMHNMEIAKNNPAITTFCIFVIFYLRYQYSITLQFCQLKNLISRWIYLTDWKKGTPVIVASYFTYDI